MRSLRRSQLRLGLLVCAALAVLLGGLPVLFALVPALGSVRLLGLPLPWLLLGVVAYPFMVGVCWFYVRQAERAEREFSELVERPH
jgi:membrane protein implicated in regulation of membrane protease activity